MSLYFLRCFFSSFEDKGFWNNLIYLCFIKIINKNLIKEHPMNEKDGKLETQKERPKIVVYKAIPS